jgi:hypothetical protein
MSLTIGEATAINTVLQYWLRIRPLGDLPSDEQVVEAMAFLADRAYRQLGAGLRGDSDVRKAWRRHKTSF